MHQQKQGQRGLQQPDGDSRQTPANQASDPTDPFRATNQQIDDVAEPETGNQQTQQPVAVTDW